MKTKMILVCLVCVLALTACQEQPQPWQENSSTPSVQVTPPASEAEAPSEANTVPEGAVPEKTPPVVDPQTSKKNSISGVSVSGKVVLSESTTLPNNIEDYFESHKEQFKLDSEHEYGALWFIKNNNEKPPSLGFSSDEVLTEEEKIELEKVNAEFKEWEKEWGDWEDIGAVIDITQSQPKLVYVHQELARLYSEISLNQSILEHYWFGSIVTVKFAEDGSVSEIGCPELDKDDSTSGNDEENIYWTFLDNIRA